MYFGTELHNIDNYKTGFKFVPKSAHKKLNFIRFWLNDDLDNTCNIFLTKTFIKCG